MVSNYFLKIIAENIFGDFGGAPLPASLWIGLSASAVNESGIGNNEPPNSTNYGRVKLTNLTVDQQGVATNQTRIIFPMCGSDWGELPYYVIYDSRTGGNFLMCGMLETPLDVSANQGVGIEAGALKLSVVDVERI